jgi:1,4-alpha-glucan branching enzyme
MYAYSENFILSLSHDEVVHLKKSLLHKMPGDEWQQFANLRLLYAYQYGQAGKKLLFMGSEWGQRREWNQDTELDWAALAHPPHAQLQALVRDLNRLHRDEPALHQVDHDWTGFDWLDFRDNQNSVVSFLRRAAPPEVDGTPGEQPDYVVCVFNFTPVPRYGYRVPVPEAVAYREILNTDAAAYGGGDVGNLGSAQGEAVRHNEHPYSMALTLPPLGAVFLKPERPPATPPADTPLAEEALLLDDEVDPGD